MGARSRCAGRKARRLILLVALGLGCAAEAPAPPARTPAEALRGELRVLAARSPEPPTPTGADPAGLLSLGDVVAVALKGEAAVVLTDGARELSRAEAPAGVHALAADGEGGVVAGGMYASVLEQYRVAGGALEAVARVALPGTHGIGALTSEGRVVFGTEAFGRGVFRATLGGLPEVRWGEGCREARGIATAAGRVVVACADGGLVALDAATLAPVARALFPGPLLALAAWEGPDVRVVTSGVGRAGNDAADATRSVLRLHTLRADGWFTLDELPSDDAEEARALLHEDGVLEVFGHARGLRKTVRVRGDALVPGAIRPWVLGVRAAVAQGEGRLTASALLDGLVSAGPDGTPRATLRFGAGRERFGELLLTTGFGRPEGAPSCGACHLDGRGDYRRHAFGGDTRGAPTTWFRGLLREPRGLERVQNLLRAHRGTELAAASDPDTRLAAAARFLARWTRAPSVLEVAGRNASALEREGTEAFTRECGACHLRPEGRAPRLFRVARRGPYLGGWDTLDEVLDDMRFEPFAHRGEQGRTLTTREREALAAFFAIW